jgi:Ca-activated chloride channel family protein
MGLAVAFGSGALEGQGWIDPVPGLERPAAVERTRSHVQVRMEGRIAQVTVEEWFHNRGGRLAEGDYIYPLPGEAVFSNVSLFQGDVELTGEMMDASRARAIYEEIVRRKRDPALIELVGHGLIRARVFPIGSGETRKVTLRFTQVLDRNGDALRFQYAAGTRNHGPRPGRGEQPGSSVTVHHPISFELIASEGSRFGDPFSPTHTLDHERRNGELAVRARDLSGHLTVFLPLNRDLVGITVATHKPTAGEPGFFMMTLSPDQSTETSVPRDLTVAIDVSGSMSGAKLVQAKAALHQILQSLNGHDQFRLTAFSSSVIAHSNEWLQVNASNLEAARTWVDRLQADGGTNISATLTEALRLDTADERLPVVLFVTDGLPSVGEQDPDRIAQSAASQRGRARVFAFGVGYDVNTRLLDRLSVEGRGSTEYVTPGESVERSLSTLASKIKHPVLTDLVIERSPVRFTEVYPGNLPDLFAGEELVIFGRYENHSTGSNVTLTGNRAGRLERFSTAADFPDHQLSNDYIPRLWAARKLGFLTRTARLEGHTEELLRDIRETALRYGLLSEYTAYLVQEPELVADLQTRTDDFRDRREVPRPVPQAPPGTGSAGTATGQEAVEFARRAGSQRAVSSEADLKALHEDGDTRDNSLNRQQVGGRTFELNNGVWTDTMDRGAVASTRIKPFSPAYFELLALAPELEQWLSRFEEVLLAGVERNIFITDDGEHQVTDRELSRLLRQFRGR